MRIDIVAERDAAESTEELTAASDPDVGAEPESDLAGNGNGHASADRELARAVAGGAPADLAGTAANATPVRELRKKDRATAKRPPGAPREERTGPVTFVRQAIAELRKVIYPTGQQLANYFVVVLVFVLFIIAFVSLLDLAFGAAILKIFS